MSQRATAAVPRAHVRQHQRTCPATQASLVFGYFFSRAGCDLCGDSRRPTMQTSVTFDRAARTQARDVTAAVAVRRWLAKRAEWTETTQPSNAATRRSSQKCVGCTCSHWPKVRPHNSGRDLGLTLTDRSYSKPGIIPSTQFLTCPQRLVSPTNNPRIYR